MGCVDLRAWMRSSAMQTFGATSAEGDCITTNWTDGEIESLFATEFMLFDELNDARST